jgi:hypothetical protein
MDGPTFADELRDEYETELSRLGSSKSLYALTGGEMNGPGVRAAAADEFESAATVLADYASAETNEFAGDAFENAVERAERHRDAVESEEGTPDASRPMYDVLSGFETSQERAAGLFARALVTRAAVSQMVGFFVGEAESSSADTFRTVRDDLDDEVDEALQALDEVCVRDEDWDPAREAASAVIEAAYDDFVETLEGMGVEPKNVC